MPIIIYNVMMDLDADLDNITRSCGKKLGIPKDEIQNLRIVRESIDARKKDDIRLNYVISLSCLNEEKIVKKLNDGDVRFEGHKFNEKLKIGSLKLLQSPLIVGSGPAGLFAGFLLSKMGYKPIIIDRGENLEDRTNRVRHFWETGDLNLESNVQFGEGGAGTFSDGKLNTRIKDYRCDYILETLVKAGAPEEIMYMGKPHVGTDMLKKVLYNMRKQIEATGGKFLFNSKFEGIISTNGTLKAAIVNKEVIPCEVLVLAIGHSSRDTYYKLFENGLELEAKPMAIGLRIEHLQGCINESQYGKYADHPRLKAADYRLTHKSKNGRGVYSFCMCPGGVVVGAATEEERLVTNGMSYNIRDKENANSAIVVSVNPEDYNEFSKANNPLKGIEFQRHYESLAFSLGGGGYIAPVQLAKDFINDVQTSHLGQVTPSYEPGYEFKMLKECLPSYVTESLKDGLISFDRKITGFAGDAVLTGIETRTSAPVRIIRDATYQATKVKGVYPAGEGAGYAGGIMSSAVDGMRIGEEIIKKYAPIL
ncbi:MAG TPA: NAD(P)/FAD-dependent oxidoreductase [Clostridiaceae bacterium]